MDRSSVMQASGVAFTSLAVWWAGITYLDGALAMRMPYAQYETMALFYPDVYYPGLPGWILASIQPFSIGVWIVAIGWMVVLSVAIGAAAVRYGPEWNWSPNVSAAGFVVGLFVLMTVVEAAAALIA